MDLVLLGVSAADYSAVPAIELISVEIIRGSKRLEGSGSCTRELVRDPRREVQRLATVCSTINPEGRIWTGTESRILRLKYSGGILRPIPEEASLRQHAFLLGLAQTTYLPTEEVPIRYGR